MANKFVSEQDKSAHSLAREMEVTDAATGTKTATDEPADFFDPRDAIHDLEVYFSGVLSSWPRSVPIQDLVEWLNVKFHMTKQEAERWRDVPVASSRSEK